MTWTLAIAILATGSILLGACGGSNGASSHEDLDCCRASAPTRAEPSTGTSWIKEETPLLPGRLDPCALVTKDDAERALGAPVQDGQRASSGSESLGQTLCSYFALGGTSGRAVQVSDVETEGMDAQLRRRGYTARQLFQDSKKMYASEPVSGVGDEAFLRGPGAIELLKGNVKLDISVSFRAAGTQPQPETVTSLARIAIARLGN